MHALHSNILCNFNCWTSSCPAINSGEGFFYFILPNQGIPRVSQVPSSFVKELPMNFIRVFGHFFLFVLTIKDCPLVLSSPTTTTADGSYQNLFLVAPPESSPSLTRTFQHLTRKRNQCFSLIDTGDFFSEVYTLLFSNDRSSNLISDFILT